jgi:hypothetical protein
MALRIVSRTGNGPRASRAASVSPGTYSMTRNGVSLSPLTSWSVQMCGWFSAATARASRSRLTRSSRLESVPARIFSATVRSSRVSRAR